ncbi:hypothetical protein VNO78_19668 [Psophocarpus tetragonolobus]|uniref:Uncharacterized protein n=1 Tax=Psophocarpus tetragonolobus TaxID=3891 RepID=A0AAN9XGF8_PSOTE
MAENRAIASGFAKNSGYLQGQKLLEKSNLACKHFKGIKTSMQRKQTTVETKSSEVRRKREKALRSHRLEQITQFNANGVHQNPSETTEIYMCA